MANELIETKTEFFIRAKDIKALVNQIDDNAHIALPCAVGFVIGSKPERLDVFIESCSGMESEPLDLKRGISKLSVRYGRTIEFGPPFSEHYILLEEKIGTYRVDKPERGKMNG